jgi:para-nitrobenzyl esterase
MARWLSGVRAPLVLAVAGALALSTAAASSAVPDAGGSTAGVIVTRGGDPSTVRVQQGVLHGAVHPDGRLFANIPFAAPPVGALRWKLPHAPAAWTGTRNATWPGPVCAQSASPITGGTGSTSEDCLTLNVYTPKQTTRKRLPVMVWFHGGAFTSGSASNYNAGVLAAKGNAIVVTANYRLGAFGWLAAPSLDAEARDGNSGNYGLADQQAALRWVQKNIRAFGGDRREVTIFGESAGGASVCAQVASPPAKGLFQRAIAESGCTSLAHSHASALTTGTALTTALGCTGTAAQQAACLRGKSTAAVLGANIGAGAGALPWSPSVGGRLLPRDIQTAFETGRYNRVPLINGTNHDEGTFLVVLALGDLRLTDATYAFAVSSRYGQNAQKILAEYPAKNYPSPTVALAATVTDSVFTCPALAADRALSKRTRVYGYEFNDPNPPVLLPADFPLGAYHSAELNYVFQRTPVLSLVPDFTPAQLALSNQIIDYWTSFAANGTPNTRSQPRWPLAVGSRVLSLDPAGSHPLTFDSVAADHNCDFWSALPPASL